VAGTVGAAFAVLVVAVLVVRVAATSRVVAWILLIGLLVTLAALLFAGNRPTPERFAAAHRLALNDVTRERVAARLRRTYRGRLLGGTAGFVIAIVIALVTERRPGYATALAAILAGTLVGIALAQFVARPEPGTVRAASLDARRPADYRPRGATVALGISLGLLLAYALACLLVPVQGRILLTAIVVPLLAVAAVALGAWLERRVVELAPPLGDPAAVAVDDALRSGAVRAIHHSTIGIVLCAAAFLGITGSSWTLMQVKVGDRVVFETHAATDVVTGGVASGPSDVTAGGLVIPDSATIQGQARHVSWIEWTDSEGDRHRREVPGSIGYQITSDTPVSVLGAFLALFTGLGALAEWRAAARAWREPGPAQTRPTTDFQLAPAGGAA
jgi:hypothetical protein